MIAKDDIVHSFSIPALWPCHENQVHFPRQVSRRFWSQGYYWKKWFSILFFLKAQWISRQNRFFHFLLSKTNSECREWSGMNIKQLQVMCFSDLHNFWGEQTKVVEKNKKWGELWIPNGPKDLWCRPGTRGSDGVHCKYLSFRFSLKSRKK